MAAAVRPCSHAGGVAGGEADLSRLDVDVSPTSRRAPDSLGNEEVQMHLRRVRELTDSLAALVSEDSHVGPRADCQQHVVELVPVGIVDRLQAMRVFLAVVDRGSLSSAASTLGLSLPPVSRILAKLERELGVRLVRGRLRTNNQEALLDAVLAGTGLAVLPVWLVKDALDEGRLLRVLAEFERPRTPVHAVLPTRGPPPKKVHAFIEFISARLRERDILSPERLVSVEKWSSR